MLAAVIALHVISWGTLVLVVEPAHFSVGDKTFGICIGLTAYTLGLRHAFDADHIAAIDNTTRTLMNDKLRPLSVGFFILARPLLRGLRARTADRSWTQSIIGPAKDGSSALHHYTSVIGAGVSGAFLFLIAIINVVILVSILGVLARMRRGRYDE